MNIDVTALKAVEREKGIPADTVIEAIESALVTAYRHADGAAKHVRVHVDRKSGEVAVLAQELGPDGEVVREWDDTPSDFGRIAASTAKQVIVQRLRDAEHEQTFGEYAGKEGDIVSGIVQAHDRRNVQGTVLIDIGKVEAVLPAGRAGARRGVHARQPDQGLRRLGRPHLPRPAGDRLAHPPAPGAQAVRPRGARDRRRQRRDRRGRPRGGAPLEDRRPHQGARPQRQGRVHRPDGPAGAQRHERAARREDRHRRLVRRPGDVRRLGAEPGAGEQRPRRRPAGEGRPRRSCPTTSCRWPSARKGQNARLAARLTGCRIDIRSDAQPDDEAATPSPGVGRPPLRSGAPAGRRRPGGRSGPPGVTGRRPDARNIPDPPRARVQGGRNVEPGPHLCGVPDDALRSANCCVSSSGPGPWSRIRGGGSPAGEHRCTPPRSACTQRSDAGPSPGRCASPEAAAPGGGRSAPGPRPRRLLGGARARAGTGE